MKLRTTTTALLLFAATSAPASILLIDLGIAGTDPTLGGTWNTLQTDSSSLFYSDGAPATGISIDLAGNSTSGTDQGTWGADKDWVDADATRDYIWDGDTVTVTLNGLNDSLTYDFSLVAVRDGGTNRVGTYTVQGATTADEVSSASINIADSFTNQTILNWYGVSPSSGSIVLEADPGPSDTVMLNALQLTAIPEPATVSLLAGLSVAALAMVRSRRRR